MDNILWHHPHRDIRSRCIVSPHEEVFFRGTRAVAYYISGETIKTITELDNWYKYYIPIVFDTKEGA